MSGRFQWDEKKDKANQQKHGISFKDARRAFFDPKRVIIEDASHSAAEKRFFCLGKVHGGVLTVRFTLRGSVVRIFGAAYWRKGKKRYEQENSL